MQVRLKGEDELRLKFALNARGAPVEELVEAASSSPVELDSVEQLVALTEAG